MKPRDSQDEYITQITRIVFDMVLHTAIYLLEEADSLSSEERLHFVECLKRNISKESRRD